VWVRDSMCKYVRVSHHLHQGGHRSQCKKKLIHIQMYVYVCACIFERAYHDCQHTHIHTPKHATAHAHAHTHTYTHTHAHAHAHTHPHTCTRAHTFTHTDTHTHTTHKDMHTHTTHTHTHTHQRKSIITVANMHLLSKFVKHSQFRNVAMARCDTHRHLSKRVWHFPT